MNKHTSRIFIYMNNRTENLPSQTLTTSNEEKNTTYKTLSNLINFYLAKNNNEFAILPDLSPFTNAQRNRAFKELKKLNPSLTRVLFQTRENRKHKKGNKKNGWLLVNKLDQTTLKALCEDRIHIFTQQGEEYIQIQMDNLRYDDKKRYFYNQLFTTLQKSDLEPLQPLKIYAEHTTIAKKAKQQARDIFLRTMRFFKGIKKKNTVGYILGEDNFDTPKVYRDGKVVEISKRELYEKPKLSTDLEKNIRGNYRNDKDVFIYKYITTNSCDNFMNKLKNNTKLLFLIQSSKKKIKKGQLLINEIPSILWNFIYKEVLIDNSSLKFLEEIRQITKNSGVSIVFLLKDQLMHLFSTFAQEYIERKKVKYKRYMYHMTLKKIKSPSLKKYFYNLHRKSLNLPERSANYFKKINKYLKNGIQYRYS